MESRANPQDVEMGDGQPQQQPQQQPSQEQQQAQSQQQQQQQAEARRPGVQLNQLRTQPGGLNAISPSFGERLLRLKILGQEEMRKFNEKPSTPIPMSPQELEQVAASLRNGSTKWKTAARWISRWFVLTQDEDRARQFFHAWFRLKDQFWDKDQMTVLKGSFTISCPEIDQFQPLFDSMARDLEQARPVSFNQGLAENTSRLQTAQPGQSQNTQQLLSGLLTPDSARSFWNDPQSPSTPIAREQGWGYPTIGNTLAISTDTHDRDRSDEKTPIAPRPGDFLGRR